MNLYQSDTKAHRDLYRKLQSLIVAPERTAWREFCQIDPSNPSAGCAKYRQCPKHIKRVDKRCWDTLDRNDPALKYLPVLGSRVSHLDKQWEVLGHATWCEKFNPLLKETGGLEKPLAAYSFGITCPECRKKADDGSTALAGLYRQCSPPCPFTGCAVPKLITESQSPGNAVEEIGPPVGCPYNPRTANNEAAIDKKKFLSNTYARVQCFLTRNEFLQYQTEVLGLHMGFFAFIGIRSGNDDFGLSKDIVYLARDPYKEIQLTQMVYDPSTSWIPDRYEHTKSYLFQASRELGDSVKGEDTLLARLQGGSNTVSRESKSVFRWRGLTQFDRDNQVLYVGDGEMSAFCIRWILEEALNLWGERGIDGDPRLKEIVTELRDEFPASEHTQYWYPRRDRSLIADDDTRSKKSDPKGWKIEDYLIDRHLLEPNTDIDDLRNFVENVRFGDEQIPPILRYIGFTETISCTEILESLGIAFYSVTGTRRRFLATERFWRLVKFLQRYHALDDGENKLAPAIDRLIALATKVLNAGRNAKVELPKRDCEALLSWIATAPNLAAHKAPITRDGCVGHIMLRRSFMDTQSRVPQRETCSRSWVAFPVFAYEPYHDRDRAESKQVGFFLGTIDDRDCYENDGTLDHIKLSEKVQLLKQWMILIGSVEAAGTYFEDIVARSEMQKGIENGIKREKHSWLQAIGNSSNLQNLYLADASPADYIKRIDAAIARRSSFLPLALRLSLFYESPQIHALTHLQLSNDGSLKTYSSSEECVAEIKRSAHELFDMIVDIEHFAHSSELGEQLFAWAPTIMNNAEPEKILNETSKILKDIIKIKPKDYASLCSNQGGTWNLKPSSDGLLGKLAKLRLSFKTSVSSNRDAEDYLLPFKDIYRESIAELSNRIKSKQGMAESVSGFRPKDLIGDNLLRDDLQNYVIRQSTIVLKELLRSKSQGDPQSLTKRLFEESDTLKMVKRFEYVIDPYVAVRVNRQFSMVPLSRHNWCPRVQQAVVSQFKSWSKSQSNGIYWVLVTPGVKKRF